MDAIFENWINFSQTSIFGFKSSLSNRQQFVLLTIILRCIALANHGNILYLVQVQGILLTLIVSNLMRLTMQQQVPFLYDLFFKETIIST